MRLTVAVPTYRRPDMLGQCLGSLVPQLADGVEVLVVDNDPDASARGLVEGLADPAIRYAHEPRPGVVNARNRAVREARGAYLGFIDDDQIAREGWVDALLRHIEMGVAASFGRVEPRFAVPVAPGLEGILNKLYRRDLGRAQDADISDQWVHVGTGNSLFDRTRCFPEPDPFSATLNATGGEDVWLARSLVARGVVLAWNPAAIVEEQVPAARATLADARARRFRQGQQRIVLMRGDGGARGWAKAAAWMGVGAAQLGLHGSRALALRAVGRASWRREAAQASGGLGKLLWWRLWAKSPYAGG